MGTSNSRPGRCRLPGLSRGRTQFAGFRSLADPVQQLVVSTCQWEKPGCPVIKAQRSAGESNLGIRIVAGPAANARGNLCPEVSCHGDAVPRVSYSVVDAVQLARVRHGIEAKVEGAAPDILNARDAQLGIDLNHLPPQDFSAAPYSRTVLGKKGGASAKQHPMVGSKAIVMKVMLGIVDHPIAGT